MDITDPPKGRPDEGRREVVWSPDPSGAASSRLTAFALDEAARTGLEDVVLLTTTARDFFRERFGFGEAERSDYEGFLTRPMSSERAREKFERLAAHAVEPGLAAELADAVAALEELETRDLTALLARTGEREASDKRTRTVRATRPLRIIGHPVPAAQRG